MRDEEAAVPPPGADSEERAQLVKMLRPLPRPAQLVLRRGLAMETLDEAVRLLPAEALRSLPAETAARLPERLRAAGDALCADVLTSVLGLRCWTAAAGAEALAAAGANLRTLLPAGRTALLADLARDERGFCAVVRKHVGKAESKGLLQLGRPRTMWLLGAAAEEGGAEPSDSRKARRTELQQSAGGAPSEDKAVEDDDADMDEAAGLGVQAEANGPAEVACKSKRKRPGKRRAKVPGCRSDSSDDGNGKKNASLAFLKSLREQRKSDG